MDRRDISTEFQDLAVERKAGNIDAKSRIKLDSISKAEYNSIITSIGHLKTDISEEIVKMNKKVSRMEELMSDFLKKLNDAFPDASIRPNSTTLHKDTDKTSSGKNKVMMSFRISHMLRAGRSGDGLQIVFNFSGLTLFPQDDQNEFVPLKFKLFNKVLSEGLTNLLMFPSSLQAGLSK